MNTNLKDKITNICGILIAIGGGILAAKQIPEATNLIPEWATTLAGLFVSVPTAIVAYLTGKNHDGSSKQSPTKS